MKIKREKKPFSLSGNHFFKMLNWKEKKKFLLCPKNTARKIVDKV